MKQEVNWKLVFINTGITWTVILVLLSVWVDWNIQNLLLLGASSFIGALLADRLTQFRALKVSVEIFY